MKAAARAAEVADRGNTGAGNAATARLPGRPTGVGFADAGASGLTIGRADDPAEREADTMAEQALTGVPLLRPGRAPPTVRRVCAQCEDEESKKVRRKANGGGDAFGGRPAPSSVSSLLARPGQSLDPTVRSYFETRFDRGFGDVTVHHGPAADTAAKSIGARAFTAGSHIAFASGQYAPQTDTGKRLLAHELAHVAQQSPKIRRAPDKPAKPTPLIPKSSSIADVMAVFARLGKADIKHYFIVDGNNLTVLDKDGKNPTIYELSRPGMVDIKGYYIGSPFYQVGWGRLAETDKGEVVLEGFTEAQQKEIKKSTLSGQALRMINEELYVIDWIKETKEGDTDKIKKFWEETQHGLIAMAVINTPLKKLKSSDNEGPVLSFELPAWFKELKAKVDKNIAEDRAANKNDPNLPDKTFYYGSDKVQAQKGPDAWTIEVEKGKREAYLTIFKKNWDEAPEKDAYARQVTGELYKKVKLILDDEQMKKDEQKEITEIDSTGEKKKGSKWGWAVALKKQIDAILTAQKSKEPEAKDFPDKLTLSTVVNGGDASAHLRVSVYDDKEVKPPALPQLSGGTLPVALKPDDKAEEWVPIVRKAADSLRRGAVTTEPGAGGEQGATGGDPTVQPAYPALIHPVDMNPDLTTATIAKNTFRMVIDVDSTHGGSLLHRTTIHMGLSIGYSWKIYPLPQDLKAPLAAIRDGGDTAGLVQKSNDYVFSNRTSLGEAKDSFGADRDWDQKVAMSGLGEGDFFVVGTATIGYPSDWKMKRQASMAGLPFTVMKAEDLAKSSAYADSDALAKLKAGAAAEKNKNKKDLLLKQIEEMEWRESHSLQDITTRDLGDTQNLINATIKLQKFIAADREKYKEYDPLMFMFRLKEHDEILYGVYKLVRQIFDRRYDDKYAVNEYRKIIEKQKEDLTGLQGRTTRLTNNKQLNSKRPYYRSVAALVKEDDGNLVPLILLVGHHVESDPDKNKYKMMLLDVTFDSPKPGDMTYVGGEKSDEASAVKSAFVEFGEDNKYGDGEVVYRVPQKGYKDKVPSITHWTEYLGYALAALSIVLLIAGSILSAGVLAPGAAAAIGLIVTGLGIAAGVAGAALAARNIYKRVEKGTFELDAEFALDVVSIIGAAVQVLGTVGKVATMTRAMGAIQRAMTLKRLDRLILIYDAVELGGNVVLVSAQVHEDLAAIDKLSIPEEKKAELRDQVAMNAMLQGAMLAHATFGKAGEIHGAIKARVENSKYRTLKNRGIIDEHGQLSDTAPASLRQHAAEPGKPASKAQQGEKAWAEAKVNDLGQAKTPKGDHEFTVTESGRIIRCSDYCTDMRMKYREVLDRDPFLNKEMSDLEEAAKAAAKAGDKTKAKATADAAANFEAKLKEADELRMHLFGATDKEIDEALESIEPGRITGGPKSGQKIDGISMPKRLRRRIDVLDIMSPAELLELAKGGWKKAMNRMNQVMGKKISEIKVLETAWNEARAEVLGKGKSPSDYTREQVIAMYKTAQRKFWEKVRKSPEAIDFLEKHGFELAGDGGAAMAVLGPKGKEVTTRGAITDQERRVSLDHIDEKAQGDNWLRALDADNLELMFQNANSWKEIFQVKFKMRLKPPTP